FFQSWNPDHADAQITDIARSTSAAPTYFPPKELFYRTEEKAKESRAFLDGGLFANNPSLAAIAAAAEIWPNDKYVVVSIGTGFKSRSLPYEEVRYWGQVDWLEPLLAIMFDA